MNDKRILVVDDETDLLEMVKSIFTRAGFTQILTASSGEAALKMCEEQEPDMMILDVMMPGMIIWVSEAPSRNSPAILKPSRPCALWSRSIAVPPPRSSRCFRSM